MSAFAVLAASVVGSLHCASMCGGFATAVTAGDQRSGVRRHLGTAIYHLGRLLGYAALAMAAGAVGLGLQGAGSMAGLHNLAGVMMGVVLIAMAIHTLLRPAIPAEVPLVRLGGRPRSSQGMGSRLRRGLAALLRRGGPLGAAGIGLGSALLPCGWLWGYVILAAATGSLGGSLSIMVAFWLGTLPAMLSVGFAASWLGRKLGPYAPRITAVVLLGLGALALAGKLQPMPAADHHESAPSSEPSEVPPCHRQ